VAGLAVALIVVNALKLMGPSRRRLAYERLAALSAAAKGAPNAIGVWKFAAARRRSRLVRVTGEGWVTTGERGPKL
jgi:hypothetical protein